MTVKLMSQSTQRIVKKLDGIIAISTISRSITPELSFGKEVIFKLIIAMAIAILVLNVLTSDKSNWIVPLNWYLAGVYFFILMLYDYYCVRTHPLNNTLKLIESIGATIYGTYILALIGNPWNLTRSGLNTLYFVTLFFLAVGQLFYLVNYGYRTPMYATKKIFKHHRSLVIDRLSEFSPEEISLATTEIELVEEKLYRDGFANITNTVLWGLLLHYISIFLFLPIDFPQSVSWLDRAAFYLLLLGIFLSLVTIAAIIKDIKNNRDDDRFTQYRLIIKPYNILVTRMNSSPMAE